MDPLAPWALAISIIAALGAIAAAVYTRSQAKVSKRALALESDPFLAFTPSTTIGISVPGGKSIPAQPTLELRNRGKGDAFTIRVHGFQPAAVSEDQTFSELKAGKAQGLAVLAAYKGQTVTATAECLTVDGEARTFTLSMVVPGKP